MERACPRGVSASRIDLHYGRRGPIITGNGVLTLDVNNAWIYYLKVIRSFKNKDTEAVFGGQFVKGLDGRIQQRAREKLKYLDSAAELRDLLIPPGNQLESLKSDREGQYSIRINKQWRVCFKWNDGDAFEVEIVDYH